MEDMRLLLIICILQVSVSRTLQQCTSVPLALNGTWTSATFGTMEISSSAMSLSMADPFGTTTTQRYFECLFNSGTQYVFRMNETLSILGGTTSIYVYGCFDFRQASDSAYYFYLNSEKEVIFNSLRFRGVPIADVNLYTSVTDICISSAVGTEEFYTIIKSGSEESAIAAVQCPDPLLGSFDYSFTDTSGTYCDNVNTSSIIACSNQSHAELLIKDTGCTKTEPFASGSGEVGCIASIYSSNDNTYYVSFYNRDSTATRKFTCGAIQQQSNGTVFMSLMPNECIEGQSPTVIPTTGGLQPTTGATMVLVPYYTCIPDTTTTKNSNWTWLIIFLVCLCVLIIFIVAILLLHRYCKNLEKKRAREKKILITEEHPLGEMSIALDAPASMERVPEGYIEVNNEFFRSPRSFKKKDMMNPMGESSMNLSFKEKSWVGLTPRKSITQMDPFTEMDSGIVMPISSLGSKTARSMKSPTKQKSFIYNSARTPRSEMNGDIKDRTLAITDGRITYPVVGADEAFEDNFIREPSFVRESITRSKSVYAPSVRAMSVHSPGKKAPSVRAHSVKPPSIAARSVNSERALSIRTIKSAKTTPKLTRSVTNTKLGSVTKRQPPSSPRKKKMTRSRTMVMPTENHEPNEGGMADFMNAEMSNWGDASETGRSKRSTRTNRTTAVKSRASTKASPRKSILKKKSKYMSSEEFLTEEEKYSKFHTENSNALSNSAPVDGTAGRSLMDAYNDMVQRNNPLSRLRRPGATRKQWH